MRAAIYDYAHRQARLWWVARYRPGDPCAIGGEPLTETDLERLDLAHDDTRPGRYLGLSCRFHNRRVPGLRRRGLLPLKQRRAIAWRTGRWSS